MERRSEGANSTKHFTVSLGLSPWNYENYSLHSILMGHNQHSRVTDPDWSHIHDWSIYSNFRPFFSIYLAHVNDVLKAVEEIAGEGIPQHLNPSKDESASSWPTLNKYNPIISQVFTSDLTISVHDSFYRINVVVLFHTFLIFCQSSGKPSLCFIKYWWQSWKRQPERFLHGKAVTILRSATRCHIKECVLLYMRDFLGHIMCNLISAFRLRVKSCWRGTWLSGIFIFWSI